MTRTLQDDLMDLASAIAAEMYGCDLDRLDPDHLDYSLSTVTADNLEDVANDLASAAWQEY
jgi:hypothetical protein